MDANRDTSGLLTDYQLVEFGRIKLGIIRLQEHIDKINHAAAQTGVPLRPIQLFPAVLMANDISQLVHAHELAEKRIAAAAFAAVDRMAA